jgi:hypothetical protein
VKKALTLLESQTYVQRNGNAYEYLTNEEQVIEEEIKNVDIDSSEISSRLFKILSGDVIKTSKIRYAKNGQDFPFSFKLDDQAHGPQRELAIHFISPEYPYSPDEIRMHSAGKDELRVILDPDGRALSDLRLLIKTEKYIRRKLGTSISATVDQILRSKGAQNTDREKELIERVRSSVGKATLVINAADITSSSQDAVTRVSDGFQDLISRTYTQLKLLGGVTYSEQQIASAANPDSGLFDAGTMTKLSAPAEEVLSFIIRKETLGEQVTVKTIVDSFQAKPYGWDLASIEVLIAFLIGTSKVTLVVDGNVLKRSEVATTLRNTQKHSHAVVTPQKTFDDSKVAAFRKFCTDFFDEANTPKDPLELARHGAEKLKGKRDELKATVAGSKYPFVAQLSTPIDLLDQVVGKPDDWYLTDFNLGDDLLDAKESVIDPIQAFLNGAQRVIYDEAAELLTIHSSNLSYLPVSSDDAVRGTLADPNRSASSLRRTEPTSSPQSRGARLSLPRAPTTPRRRPLLRRACCGRSIRRSRALALRTRSPSSASSGQASRRASIQGCSINSSPRSRRVTTTRLLRSRPCTSRPSRPSGLPESLRRKRTSIDTLPLFAMRSSRP